MKTHTEGGHDPDADRLTVGLSEWRTAADGQTLVSHGVGASVAVVLYDPESGIGGVARPVLPRAAAGDAEAPEKYVDAAVRGVVEEMVETGASYAGIRAWLVGGSTPFELDPLDDSVGERTVAATVEILAGLDVGLAGRATGGDRGRTVELDTATGEVSVRTAFGEPRPL